MPKVTDLDPERALVIAQEQSKRLRLLRRRLNLKIYKAAEFGMVLRDAWSRMETGESKINPVALQRFVNKITSDGTRITAEYVITGTLFGMDEDLRLELAEIEAAYQRGDIVDSPESEDLPPPSKKPRKSKASTAT